MVAPSSETGLEALHIIKSTDPPLWLAPSPSLSHAARSASQHIFSALRPFTPKSPFDHLLIDGFDAEQIWQQIDIQSQPLLSSIRRDLKRFEKNPVELTKLNVVIGGEEKVIEDDYNGLKVESDDFDEELDEFDKEDEEDDKNDNEFQDNADEERGSDDVRESGESEDEEDGERGGGGGIEDGFFKINELEDFLEEDEAREYGLKNNSSAKGDGGINKNENGGDEDGESDDEDDDELGEFGMDKDGNKDIDKLGNARYGDFFGTKKKKTSRRNSRSMDGSEDSDSGDEEPEDEALETQKSENLSTHEKHLKKLQSEIERMEKANLEPKTWTMQGEVTAAKRPKNSALEVDLDFEHNVRPAPVITEEVTATLEELIEKRILEGLFDDVQKAPSLPSKAPRERKEFDDNKSKKGLGEIYEEEFVQKTNIAFAPLSFSDEMKKEASMLFKKLCLKLDALSHFYFTPKPVIEDISIQENVPALAMEEIAPLAISDAAMLAPEEVFSGKGDIKEEAELTQSERKRRRANKKRRHRAMVTKTEMKRAKKDTERSAKNHAA